MKFINPFAENGSQFSDKEILPGRQLPPECHAELHTDYGGAALRWGLTHHKESAYDCCMACLDHSKRAKPGQRKCNIWVYCPSQNGCYSPDIYKHKYQECWLKYVSLLVKYHILSQCVAFFSMMPCCSVFGKSVHYVSTFTSTNATPVLHFYPLASLQSETPHVNFKDRYSEAYRDSHPRAPVIVPWVSGVVSA